MSLPKGPYWTSKAGVFLKLYVQPNASKSQIIGIHGDALKVKIKAPPVEGKANEEIIRFFSKFFGVPKDNLEIISGDLGRNKVLKIEASEDLIKKLLGQFLL